MGGDADFFTYLMERLSTVGLAFVEILDGFGFGHHNMGRLLTAFDTKQVFKGHVLVNGSYTRDIAKGAIRSGAADIVGFGARTSRTPTWRSASRMTGASLRNLRMSTSGTRVKQMKG